MFVALIIALLVGIVVKLVLGVFSTTAPYADVVAVIVAVLVFLSRSGLAL